MLSWLLLTILALLSCSMLIWGISRKERFYQYPTISGAVWFFYIVPQAIGAIRNPYKFPERVLEDKGLEIALSMCIHCTLAGWFGYISGKWERIRLFRSVIIKSSTLFKAGLLLYLISFYAAYKLASLTGGFLMQFTGGGHYSLEWRGLPVRYALIIEMMYPSLFLCLLATLKKPSFIRIIVVLVLFIYPLANIIFLGRRSVALFLTLIILLSFFFAKKYVPSRVVLIIFMIIGTIFAVILPQYRTITQYGIDMESLKEIKIPASIQNVISGNLYQEFDALVVGAALINREKIFGFGTGFYNSTIAQLIPRELIGEELKNRLMVSFGKFEKVLYSVYQWTIPYGSNPTGPLNAFHEFWFFGAIIYYFIGLLSRNIFEYAYRYNNIEAQFWYVIWCSKIPVTILGSLTVIPGHIITYMVFFTPLFWAIKKRIILY